MAAAAAAATTSPADPAALLLELAASDDLAAFTLAAAGSNLPLDSTALWYGRSLGSRRMSLERRTPLHIAALYGSTSILRHILTSLPSSVNSSSGSDSATALHCAAAGGAPSSLLAVHLLLDASADPDSLDSAGNRPGDLIARSPLARSLELLLKPSSPRTPSPERDEVRDKERERKEKEYPLDLTLPDIKNGIYGTDEFRMYTFKVKPCSRAYSHDWTECPFVHPGENARRRDPRKYLYSCVPCPEFRKGACRNGDACDYAHGVFECWLHPAQYRTRLCKDETGCNRRVCFFAHKPEELRTVNPMAASVSGVPPASPRSPSIGDMAAALMMMQSAAAASGAPMSPSGSPSSGMSTSPVWMNQPPALQLSGSRLKSALSARDMDYDLDLVGLEGYQHKLISELSGAASPRSNLRANMLNAAAASRASDYSDLLGSLDPSVLSQLRGLSTSQFQSSTAGIQRHQAAVSQQLLSGYGGNMPSSPTMSQSSSLGLDLSTAKAIMNSRASAFAKRSQSFIDRGGRQTSLAAAAMTASAAAATSGMSEWGSPNGKLDWGSPNGKVDWGMQGDELNKLRKSASFAYRSISAAAPMAALDEPDLSWVHSLVKDGPVAAAGASPASQLQKQNYQMNGGNGYMASEKLPPWAEQMFAEQEQMVA